MRRPVSVKDVFLLLSCKDVFSFCFLFPSCGFLRIRAGPPLSPSFHPHSWLSDFRSVHGGCSQFSPLGPPARSEEHTSELQSPCNLVCRLLLEKKKQNNTLQQTTE